MINLAGLVGRITGKGGAQAEAGQATTPEVGAATDGAFAALVRLAQGGTGGDEAGKPVLVVDNGATPPGAPLPDPALIDAANPAFPAQPPVATDSAPNKVMRQLVAQAQAEAKAKEASANAVSDNVDLSAPALVVGKDNDASAESRPDVVGGKADEATPDQAMAALLAQTQPAAPAPQVAAQSAGGAAPTAPETAALIVQAGQELSAISDRRRPFDPLTPAAHAMTLRAAQGTEAASSAASLANFPDAASIASAAEAGAGLGAASSSSTAPASSAASAGASGPSLASSADGLTMSSSLNAIVNALPPVVQSELGAPVRAVAGPSTGQALGDQVIDMGVSGQWIDRMAKEIAGIADGSGHSRFTLNPPHLGRLQVDLWQGDGATNVRLLAETDEAARRLSEGRSALQADARVAALSLGTIVVEKSSAAFDSSAREQGQRSGSDLAGQMQQQADSQAQSRAGQGQAGSQGNGQGSDWMRRTTHDERNETGDASARASAQRSANGHVRFA
jgi:flagellar hook-length control protein FliK